MTSPTPPQKNDWLAWALHAFVGGALGMICGWAVAYGKRRRHPILFSSFEAGIPFVIGAMLLGAAFGSYLGERWWSGPSLFRAHPEGFAQSRAGRTASRMIGLFGAILMVAAVLHNRGVF